MTFMKAVTFRDFGGPEMLQLTQVAKPEPGPSDVLVKIHAAGICYHDVLSRAGKIPATSPVRFSAMRSPVKSRRSGRTCRPTVSASAS